MMKKEDVMELIDMTKLTNMINGLKDKEIVVKEKHTINWKKVACVVGVIAAVAGVAYAIYRYFKKDYEDEFMDDFDDWDDDEDLFEDDAEEDVQDLEEES